jgi:hypothetical protein
VSVFLYIFKYISSFIGPFNVPKERLPRRDKEMSAFENRKLRIIFGSGADEITRERSSLLDLYNLYSLRGVFGAAN